MTTWDPKFFPGGNVIWLHGTNEGESVFVVAARLFDSLDVQHDLESLKVFYLDPHNRHDVIQVNIPNTLAGRGPCVHTGNLYISPAFRGKGLAAFATRKLHHEILRRWDVDWIFGLQEKELAYKGLWQSQGYPHCEGEVIWDHNPYGREFRMKVVWGSRDEISRSL